MALSALVSAVHAQSILTGYVSPVTSTVSPVTGTLGAENRFRSDTLPPYAVWIPRSDRFDGNFQQGPTPASRIGTLPKSIRTRWVGFEVQLAAELNPVGNIDDFDTAEDLVNQFLYAMHLTFFGSYHFESGHYMGQDGEEILNDRKIYVLRLAVATPVFEPASIIPVPSTATISSEAIAAGISTAISPPP